MKSAACEAFPLKATLPIAPRDDGLGLSHSAFSTGTAAHVSIP